MDEALALAAEKLLKTQHPFLVHPHKYQIEGLKKAAAALKRALEQAGVKPSKPARGPAWFQKLMGKARPKESGSVKVLQAKLTDMKARLATMEASGVELILTPLSLADEGVCHAYYFKHRLHLATSIPVTDDPLEKDAREQAIEFGANHYYSAKHVQLVAKKMVAGQLVPAFTERAAHSLDMRIAQEILSEYREAFVLGEEELGKFVAPSRAA